MTTSATRLRCRERGQAAIEYAGALLAVSMAIAAVAAVFGPSGLSGKLRSEIHHELCTVGIESFDRTCPGETAAQPPTRAQVDRQALTQALSLQDPDLSGTRLLGWVTYFSEALKPSNELPPGVMLHELGSGSLITIGDDPAQIPEDLVLATRDALGEQVLGRK